MFCLLSGIWTFFFVKETNGKTLEEMDYVFGDSSSVADEERKRRIESQLESTVGASPSPVVTEK